MQQHEQPKQTGALFPTTQWSEIVRTSDADPAVRQAALTSLLNVYVPALAVYVRWHRRLSLDRLDDLLQGFVCDKVVADELFSYADPARGRFRLFVLKSLERYIRRVHRYESAAKRSPGGGQELISLDGDDQTAGTTAAEVSFDLAWARQVIQQAMQRMREDCRKGNRDGLWSLFQARVVRPIFEDEPALEYEKLVPQLGLTSAAQAANLLVTGKRLFARHLRTVIGEYTIGENDIDDELRHLWGVFSQRGSSSRPQHPDGRAGGPAHRA
jgi:hypothetical protein